MYYILLLYNSYWLYNDLNYYLYIIFCNEILTLGHIFGNCGFVKKWTFRVNIFFYTHIKQRYLAKEFFFVKCRCTMYIQLFYSDLIVILFIIERNFKYFSSSNMQVAPYRAELVLYNSTGEVVVWPPLQTWTIILFISWHKIVIYFARQIQILFV